jgi:hypothetical protein
VSHPSLDPDSYLLCIFADHESLTIDLESKAPEMRIANYEVGERYAAGTFGASSEALFNRPLREQVDPTAGTY